MTTEASQPTTVQVKVTLNGAEQEAAVEPRLLLVHFIRETLNLNRGLTSAAIPPIAAPAPSFWMEGR